MPTERNPHFVGRGRHRVEHVARQPFVDFDEVVSALVILAHQLRTLLGGGHAGAAHRCAPDEQAWTNRLTPGDLVSRRKLRPVALHPTYGGHPVGHVEEQEILAIER